MDFTLNEQQEMLRTSARQFLTKNCPKTLVRQMVADEKGYTQELWEKIAELGWLGLIFPAEYGGAEGSFLDLVVLLEEMGRFCFPGPFFSTAVLGSLPVLWAGTREQKDKLLGKVAKGELILTLAFNEPGTYYSSNISTKALEDRNGYVISGSKIFVPDAHVAHYIICPSRTNGSAGSERGITLFLVSNPAKEITVIPLKTVAGDKQSEITLDKVKVPKDSILGERDGGWELLQKTLQYAMIGKCAEMVGGAQQVLEMAVAYVKERQQFGRPVGSFQAVQHHCANMFLDAEAMRFITYKAAWKVSQGLPSAKEVSMAKAWVSDAYQRVVLRGHQVQGGVGFTEAHDMSLYFKRAKAAQHLFGDAKFHREKIAESLVA